MPFLNKTNCSDDEFVSLHFIAPQLLKPTEKYSSIRVSYLEKKIKTENVWIRPLLVERNHYIIMDGHHRLQVSKEFNLFIIPCFFISYSNPYLKVSSRRQSKGICIQDIINAGLTGNLLPYKTTRHQLLLKLPDIFIPLNLLMRDNNFGKDNFPKFKVNAEHENQYSMFLLK